MCRPSWRRRSYRFEEAVVLSRKALEIDPNDVRTLSALGVQLLRTGDEAEARQVLEKSFAIDKFDKTTFNLLTMLDSLDKFDTITDGNIVFKSHPSETAVMREYVAPLAQQALATFSEKYKFTPKGPILIEMFPKHDDFAVRTVGLPGMIGALGACFGRVVTLDSPKARPPGDFNWAPTLWHELAHVMTLQLSKQRVPRWLTEGISTYEEKLGSPAWGREGELSFAAAYGLDEHMTVRELNAAFQDPEKISLAYYEASILTEHIVGKYGMDALRKLLVTYGEGLEGEAALKAGLGVDIDTLQADFDKLLAAKYGSVVRALKPPKELEPGKGDPEAIASAFPDSFQAQVALGEFLRKTGRIDEAFKVLERAAEMVPMATGPRSPRAMMAQMALERKDSARAISELEKLLRAREHRSDVGATARAGAGGHEGAGSEADIGLRAHRAARSVRRGEPFEARSPEDAGGRCAHGRPRVPRRDCRRVARSGVRAFRPCGKLSGRGRQSAGASRGSRRDRSGARVSARAGAAVEGGRPMIRLRAFAALLILAAVMSPRAAAAEERYALIVSGVSGTEKFAASQKEWVSSLQSTLQQRLGFAADRVTVLSESGSGTAIANRENVTRTLASFKSRLTADDTLLIVLIGHGTFDGTAAKFNLVGPDMDSREWKASLDGNPARLVFVNTTSSSFQFVPALSGKNRIVIAATDSAAQKYATLFPQYFIEALGRGREGRQRQERPTVRVGSVRVREPGCEAGVRKAGNARHRAIGHRRQRRRRRQRGRGSDRNGRRACQDDVSRSASCVELWQHGARRAGKAAHHSRSRDRTAEGEERRDAGGPVRRRIRAARHRARQDLGTDPND